jgi:general secretion pathway protein N
MGALFARYPILIALGAVAAVLAGIVAWEAVHDSARDSQLGATPVRRAAPFEAKLLPAPPVVAAEQAYPEFAARPLWTPTRRPAPAALPPSTYTPGQYALLGVIIAGGNKTAMLREKSNGKLHRVEAGRQLNGITVAEIAPDSVTLTQGADREVLPLTVQRAGSPLAGGAAGQPPGAAPPLADFGPARPAGGVPQPQPVPQPPTPPAAPAAGFFGTQPATPPPGAAPPAANPNPLAPAPNAQAVPTPAGSPGAMTAEELLARRRARRGQTTQ